MKFKKKLLSILFILIIVVLLLVALLIHSKTYNLRIELIKGVYSDITLNANDKSCNVTSIVKKYDEIIETEILKNDGYKKN